MSVIDEVDRLTRVAGENRLELLLFRLAAPQVYGINVFKIRELLPCPALRHIPYAHRHVRGVMQTRGQTVTVIDLAAVLDQPRESGTEGGIIVITEYYGRVLGYLVRDVIRIVNLDWAGVMPPPALLGERTYMTAVTSIDGALVEIIDIESVLADIVGVSSNVTREVRIAAAGPRGLPRHVFVADDSAVARKQIARVMEQIGVTYEVAENGRIALDKLRAHAAAAPIRARFGMLISDIEMPVMDGYTLTRHVKADPALKGLYVCLHTSLSGGFNRAMAASVGADRLLPKFDPDELAKEVTEVMTVAEVLPATA